MKKHLLASTIIALLGFGCAADLNSPTPPPVAPTEDLPFDQDAGNARIEAPTAPVVTHPTPEAFDTLSGYVLPSPDLSTGFHRGLGIAEVHQIDRGLIHFYYDNSECWGEACVPGNPPEAQGNPIFVTPRSHSPSPGVFLIQLTPDFVLKVTRADGNGETTYELQRRPNPARGTPARSYAMTETRERNINEAGQNAVRPPSGTPSDPLAMPTPTTRRATPGSVLPWSERPINPLAPPPIRRPVPAVPGEPVGEEIGIMPIMPQMPTTPNSALTPARAR